MRISDSLGKAECGTEARDHRTVSFCSGGTASQPYSSFSSAGPNDTGAGLNAFGPRDRVDPPQGNRDCGERSELSKSFQFAARAPTTIRQIRSQGVYTDASRGNVIEHVAAENADGRIVYIGTRLRVTDGKISEVEINFDDRPNVNAKNIIPYDPVFNTIVPPEERAGREQLERIITSYFQGMTDHQPIEADYDVRCDRYHSGNRVTHNPRNGVKSSGDVGCYREQSGTEARGTRDGDSH